MRAFLNNKLILVKWFKVVFKARWLKTTSWWWKQLLVKGLVVLLCFVNEGWRDSFVELKTIVLLIVAEGEIIVRVQEKYQSHDEKQGHDWPGNNNKISLCIRGPQSKLLTNAWSEIFQLGKVLLYSVKFILFIIEDNQFWILIDLMSNLSGDVIVILKELQYWNFSCNFSLVKPGNCVL